MLGQFEGPRIRKNPANHPVLGRLRGFGSPITCRPAALAWPGWHTSCNVVLHNADPSAEMGKQEAE
jgi:hypothetical protein